MDFLRKQYDFRFKNEPKSQTFMKVLLDNVNHCLFE